MIPFDLHLLTRKWIRYSTMSIMKCILSNVRGLSDFHLTTLNGNDFMHTMKYF